MCQIPANAIAALDRDELTQDEVDSLFQSLVDTGAIWRMDINHVYMAAALIQEGRVVPPLHESEGDHEGSN